MNRHERRGARKKGYDDLYSNYVRHLPQVPVDAPIEPGSVHHLVIHHDDWCKFYDKGNFDECNCNPIVTRHAEPSRS
jgi:hypothetical protein